MSEPAGGTTPGLVVWLTGLVSAGKSTLARGAARKLADLGHPVAVVDGDELRRANSSDLGFSRIDRRKNVQRAAQLAAGHAEHGRICLVAVIAPYAADRAEARGGVSAGRFLEVHVNAPLTTCEQRDPKGLYARARAGELVGLTGLSDPYEEPPQPDLVLATHQHPVDVCVAQLVGAILQRLA